MNHAIKLGRFTSQSSSFLSSTSSSLYSIQTSSKGSGRVGFVHVSSGRDPNQPNLSNMDYVKKDDQKDKKKLNVMEESFGEGYSTRSDEEGFGGVYGSNAEDNAEMKIVQDPAHYDNSQGSEVKEKEVARNQTKAQRDRT
ncbi:hypothetical protein KSS87_002860 [Heliosperma pusillum]|nr:hypothetical protein KSS87_002860 [Heliosperma pusillum]